MTGCGEDPAAAPFDDSAPAGASSAGERIRVAVVDDQELFVYGLRMLIESQPDLELVGTGGDGAAAVEIARRERPDVLLLDIRMPEMNGIEATHRIVTAGGGTACAGGGADRSGAGKSGDGTRRDGASGEGMCRVVVLTTFQQEEAVFQAMKHGASAFVTKDVAPEVLLDTIRSVHAGDAPPTLIGTVVRGHLGQAGAVGAPTGSSGGGVSPSTAGAPRSSGTGRADPDAPDGPIAELSPREREIYLLTARGLRNADIAKAAFVTESTVKSHVRSILAKLSLTSRAQIVVHAYENRLLIF
ncbi:response regulator [Herbiconiux sp. A18JL235]|uniref:Response regulator n=1 Tax=Herbiconiux sp. A18JL235 TaxID=3152363 RepID=A0AB39BKS4_9MICO